MPAAVAVDWIAIEKSAIAGVTYAQLSQRYGVSEVAIRSRASRYKWPVSFRPGPTMARPEIVTKAQQIATNEAVAATIQESVADAHSRTAAALVQASAAALARFAEAAPAPENWQEAATAYKVQRLAAGIDKEGGEIKVNVAMFAEALRPVDEGESWGGVSAPVIISPQVAESEG